MLKNCIHRMHLLKRLLLKIKVREIWLHVLVIRKLLFLYSPYHPHSGWIFIKLKPIFPWHFSLLSSGSLKKQKKKKRKKENRPFKKKGMKGKEKRKEKQPLDLSLNISSNIKFSSLTMSIRKFFSTITSLKVYSMSLSIHKTKFVSYINYTFVFLMFHF